MESVAAVDIGMDHVLAAEVLVVESIVFVRGHGAGLPSCRYDDGGRDGHG
tara:strand:+ start:1511 stop:1660 length:150 start_codon:yes stop_codon:yes gene_type:complete